MRKRTVSLVVASTSAALILAACVSTGNTPVPAAGPNGLMIQNISTPKLNLSFLSIFQSPRHDAVQLPARSVRGEDEPTSALANLIIARAEKAQQAKAAQQISAQPVKAMSHMCSSMMGD